MIRRDLTVLIISALMAWPLAAAARPDSIEVLRQAKRSFDSLSHPTETARVSYITRLIRLRERAVRSHSGTWKDIDAEIRKHPAPADPAALSRRLVGTWQSPRHDYQFMRDGTWTMLPADPGTTNGTWRIEGNQYVDTASLYPDKPFRATVILIDKKHFVTADDEDVFYQTRLK